MTRRILIALGAAIVVPLAIVAAGVGMGFLLVAIHALTGLSKSDSVGVMAFITLSAMVGVVAFLLSGESA